MKSPHIFRNNSRLRQGFLLHQGFGGQVGGQARLRTAKPDYGGQARMLRLLIALAILLIFGWLVSLQPAGRNIQNKQEVDIASEIAKTLKVVGNRPDYAAAWLRLSLLYEKAGNEKLAKQARDKSKETGGDF